jgi:hypothetical protein
MTGLTAERSRSVTRHRRTITRGDRSVVICRIPLELDTKLEPYEFCPKSDDEVGETFQPVDDDVDSELQR